MAEVREGVGIATATDVATVTTAETVAVTSGSIKSPSQTGRVLVVAWAQYTTGPGTTAVTPRIRRGSTATGTLVGEANAEQVKAAAGSTEPVFIMVAEDRSGVADVEYSFTLEAAGATGNGSVLQAGMLVLVV